MVLKLLSEKFQERSVDTILDLGPVCQENIDFFAERVRQLYVCDLFARLNKIKKSKEPLTEKIWDSLDYPPDSFDCINLWDFLDHLTDDEALNVVRRCHEMVKLYGLILVTAMEKTLHPHHTTFFTCSPECSLTLRALSHIHLPFFYRHNRALMSFLDPLEPIKIFRYHNGIREMLFQRT